MPTTTLARPRARQGAYLSKTCTEAIAKDNMPLTYPEELKLSPSLFQQDLFDAGNEFEDYIRDVMVSHLTDGSLAVIEEIRDENGDRTTDGKNAKELATWEAYTNPNIRFVFNPRIGQIFEEQLSAYLGTPTYDEKRISEPDLIELGDVLPNGLRSMTFIDVKWHKITKGTTVNPKTFFVSTLDAPSRYTPEGPRDFYGTVRNEDWRQLAHYYRHAQTLGLAAPGSPIAGVIGKEEVVIWGNLDELSFRTQVDGKFLQRSPLGIYDQDFEHALAVIDNARERDIDPTVEPITFPEWKDECKQCPWRDVCHAELVAFGNGGHITLLPGITPNKAAPLYRMGIRDAATLAVQDPLDSSIKPEFIYTARVALDGRPHLAMDVNDLDLERADVEVDFDCESESTVYMWGVRVTDRATGEVTEHMFDDYTGTDEGEARVFAQVWAYFQSLMVATEAADRTVRFYHYTRYERVQMMALANKHEGVDGVPGAEDVEAFFRDSGAVIDLYEVLSKQIVWPTESHSIKELAPFTGFAWQDETPGGDMSMLWYRTARDDTDPQVRDENIARLRQYNLDDVHAQAHLRNWVTATPLPQVTLLDPPVI